MYRMFKKFLLPFNGSTLRVYMAVLAAIGTAALVNGATVSFFGEGIEVTGDHNNIVRSLVDDGPCPDGWDDKSGTAEHTQVKSCEREGWLVILNQDESFNYGVQLDTPGAKFVFDRTKVPGWPR